MKSDYTVTITPENMERTDSTAAMASLASYDDKSDDDIPNQGSVDNISDDEHDDLGSRPSSRPVLPGDTEGEEENSKQSFATPTEIPKPKPGKKTTRLVSNYGIDDEEEDDMSISSSEDDDEDDVEEEGEEAPEKRVDRSTSLNSEQASSLSRSMLNKSFDEIEIPPAPAGKCSNKLQDKIAGLFDKMRREGLDMNAKIQRRKDFRNPSIYEKLIEFIGIDEKGSNYPPEVFDPHSWGKESFYDALDKAQKTEMEKREKERKDRTKIEFMTGTKRPNSGTEATTDDKKRKSKWDTQPVPNVTGSRGGLPGVINPSVVTGSASGTKSTVIPATGNITKKPK